MTLVETKALMRSWKFCFVLHVLRQDLKQGTFSISTLSKQIISQTNAVQPRQDVHKNKTITNERSYFKRGSPSVRPSELNFFGSSDDNDMIFGVG